MMFWCLQTHAGQGDSGPPEATQFLAKSSKEHVLSKQTNCPWVYNPEDPFCLNLTHQAPIPPASNHAGPLGN